jgi:hypothetical protein
MIGFVINLTYRRAAASESDRAGRYGPAVDAALV